MFPSNSVLRNTFQPGMYYLLGEKEDGVYLRHCYLFVPGKGDTGKTVKNSPLFKRKKTKSKEIVNLQAKCPLVSLPKSKVGI